jgi:hypothetical protein
VCSTEWASLQSSPKLAVSAVPELMGLEAGGGQAEVRSTQ